MRSGEVYDSNLDVVAIGVDSSGAPVVPLGTRLLICPAAEEGDGTALGGGGTCVIGVVKDTGYLPEGNLDVSPNLFRRLAPLDQGRVRIVWAVLE